MTRPSTLGPLGVVATLVAAWSVTVGSHAARRASAAGLRQVSPRSHLPFLSNRSRSAGPICPGFADGGVQLQNLGADAASLEATFYRLDGDGEWTIPVGLVAPGASANIALEGTSLPQGQYAGIVSADQPMAGLVRMDWYSRATDAAAMYGAPDAGRSVVVPVLTRRFHNQTSFVAVQNTAAVTRTAHVEIRRMGEAGIAFATNVAIGPGRSALLDLTARDFRSLGDGFLGSALVEARDPLAVAAFVCLAPTEGPTAVYAFEGIPSESASTELLVPLFRAEQRAASDPASARIDTGIGVFNPGTTTANARIEYSGADHPAASPACRAQRFTSPTIAIPAHASHVFYQGNPSSEGLPAGCFGSARVVADSPVMAIVNEAINLGEKAAAYNAVSRPAGSRRLALPLWRRNHAGGLSTGISVMNAGTSAAHVAVAFSRALPAGSTEAVVCPAGCALELEPLEMGVLWPPLIDALPDNAYGSAVIESTQPVVAIVNDVAFSAVDMATYNAIALPAGAR